MSKCLKTSNVEVSSNLILANTLGAEEGPARLSSIVCFRQMRRVTIFPPAQERRNLRLGNECHAIELVPAIGSRGNGYIATSSLSKMVHQLQKVQIWT
jgi:hypothetical protein